MYNQKFIWYNCYSWSEMLPLMMFFILITKLVEMEKPNRHNKLISFQKYIIGYLNPSNLSVDVNMAWTGLVSCTDVLTVPLTERFILYYWNILVLCHMGYHKLPFLSQHSQVFSFFSLTWKRLPSFKIDPLQQGYPQIRGTTKIKYMTV